MHKLCLCGTALLLMAVGVGAVQAQITVPAEFVSNVPIVEVKLDDGQTAHMLLDTGATTTFFSREGAARLKLKLGPVPPQYKGFVSGMGAFSQISIGDLKAEQVPFAILKIRRNVWQVIKGKNDVDGSLGIDVLSRYAVGLDMVGNTVTFWPGGHLTPPQLAAWLGDQKIAGNAPLTRGEQGHYSVTATIDGVPIQHLFDTGAADLGVPQRFLAVLPPLQRLDPYQFAAVDRAENDVSCVFRSFALGAFEMPFPFAVVTSGKSVMITDPTVGMAIFRDCKLLLDFPAGLLSVARMRTGTRAAVETLARLGIFATGETGKEVLHIAAGSPAERTGLRTGDHLLHYDGLAPAQEHSTPGDRSATPASDPPITLQIRRDGASASLTFTLNRTADTAWIGATTVDQFPPMPPGYMGVKRFPHGGIFQNSNGKTEVVPLGGSVLCQNGQYIAFIHPGITPDADQQVEGNLRLVDAPDDPSHPPQLAAGEGTLWVAGKGWVVGPVNTTVHFGGFGLTLVPPTR
jgi:hypothetical protein